MTATGKFDFYFFQVDVASLVDFYFCSFLPSLLEQTTTGLELFVFFRLIVSTLEPMP